MSLTPGWEPKPFKAYTPGVSITFSITQDGNFYYIDNGQEFKKFPETKEGWSDLCETLKGFEP